MSSVFYIILSLFFTSIMLTVIFFVAWKNFGKKNYALIWSFTFLLASFQWILNLTSQQLFSDRELYWLIVNIFTILVGTTSLIGHYLRVNKKVNYPLITGLTIVTILMVYYFTYVHVHAGLRYSIAVFHNAIAMSFIVHAISSHKKKNTAAEIGACSIYSIFLISQFIAGSAALLQGAELQADYMEVYRLINFTVLPSAYIGISLFVVFMLASDLSEEMKILAITDELTGTLNRRGFYQHAEASLQRNNKALNVTAVAIFDLDHFKTINDRYGHQVGDQVLKSVVQLVNSKINDTDTLGRVGGEEFALIIHEMEPQNIKDLLTHICNSVEGAQLMCNDNKIKFTISVGLTIIHNDGLTKLNCIDELMGKADRALYQAKNNGRNQVYCH